MTSSSTHHLSHWNIEKICHDLEVHGFTLIECAYPEHYLKEVRAECLKNLDQFREAGIQNGVMNHIRSDHILWIEDHLSYANQHTSALLDLGHELNQYFFTSIREIEAHFARYQCGEFYALHRDNPQQKNHRVFSTVFYTHEQWQSEWGGQLHLQDKNTQWHMIDPMPNRLVVFQSDLLHEVYPALQQRLSITAWLRSMTSSS